MLPVVDFLKQQNVRTCGQDSKGFSALILKPRDFGGMINAMAGGLPPGGPHVNLPIVAVLLKSGAGIGTMVAFLTGWSL